MSVCLSHIIAIGIMCDKSEMAFTAFLGGLTMAKRVRRSLAPSGAPVRCFDPDAGRAQVGSGGVLLEFPHGLGDLVQLSVILRHLTKHNPTAAVDVVCEDEKSLSHSGLERHRFGFHAPRYSEGGWDQVVRVAFPEFTGDVSGFPNTKCYRCLTEELGIAPEKDLFTYSIVVGADARARAGRYLGGISSRTPDERGRFPVVVIHYQGCSSRMNKDLPNESVQELCSAALLRGRSVVILDFERLSPLVDQSRVFAPLNGNTVWSRPGIADPETMAAMIDQCELFMGIDSGPLHVAGALTVPAIGVWTHHHPVRYFDLAPNVLHLVPSGSKRLAGGPNAEKFFQENYRHKTYGCLRSAMIEEMHLCLKGDMEPTKPRSSALPGLTATGYDEQYYVEHVNAGLDYLGHGDWQRQYATWLADVFRWRSMSVLDVGCACGSIMRGLGHAGIVVQGVDVSEFMVNRGRRKWPDQAALMHVGDAINLHWWPDAEWDGLHSAQVAEHWRPELVPFILRELGRVTKPGGLFFCTLDTVRTIYAKQP